MIELKNLSVKFGSMTAVDDVSLTVHDGDIFGIVGFSGAGKSTLVRTVNLLQRPTSGQVLVDGTDLTALPAAALRAARKRIGMIFQNFNLLASRTVLDNVIYPIRKANHPREALVSKAQHLLELVGIGDKADAYPAQLSGGQKQRCAIARALASDPSILLCDEATSALDPKTTKAILKLLKTLNSSLGITIVLITHEMRVVKEICNRCAVMQAGRIVEQGDTLDIFARPKAQLTRDFIQTASDFNDLLDEIRSGTLHLQPHQQLAQIRYVGDAATEPLIHDLYLRFGIRTNILAGNIELISGTPVGNLVVSLEDPQTRLKEAVAYLAEFDTVLAPLGGHHEL